METFLVIKTYESRARVSGARLARALESTDTDLNTRELTMRTATFKSHVIVTGESSFARMHPGSYSLLPSV